MPQRRGTPPGSGAGAPGRADVPGCDISYDRLARLRARTPVVWLDGRRDGRPGAWAVLRYSDVRYALVHPEVFAPEPEGMPHGLSEAPGGAAPEAPGDVGPRARAMLARVPDGEAVDFVARVAGDVPETVLDALCGGLQALLRHPGQYDRLRERRGDDRLIDSAVEEMLRWWTPVTRVARTVRRGTVLGGVPLLAGERVTLWLASANHDEEVFAEPAGFLPERFLADRAADRRGGAAGPGRGRVPRARRHQREQRVRPQLCFGCGDRTCPGARVVRVHLRAFLVALLERPGRPAAAGEPVILRSSARHGLERLPLRWTG